MLLPKPCCLFLLFIHSFSCHFHFWSFVINLILLSFVLCVSISVTRWPSRWDGHDVKQHKGGRSFSDRPWPAIYTWPLQEIVHSTQQEPCHQREGAHSPSPAEHSEGESRSSGVIQHTRVHMSHVQTQARRWNIEILTHLHSFTFALVINTQIKWM